MKRDIVAYFLVGLLGGFLIAKLKPSSGDGRAHHGPSENLALSENSKTDSLLELSKNAEEFISNADGNGTLSKLGLSDYVDAVLSRCGNDPELILKTAQRISNPRIRNAIFRKVASILKETDPLLLVELSSSFPKSLWGDVRNKIVEGMAKGDGKYLEAFLKSGKYKTAFGNDVASSALCKVAEGNPDAAISLALAMPTSTERLQILSESGIVIQRLAIKSPQKAFELRTQFPDVKGIQAACFAYAIAANPAGIESYIREIPDGLKGKALSSEIAQALFSFGKIDSDLLAKLLPGERSRLNVISQATMNNMGSPEKFIETISKLSDPYQRSTSLATSAELLMKWKPAASFET